MKILINIFCIFILIIFNLIALGNFFDPASTSTSFGNFWVFIFINLVFLLTLVAVNDRLNKRYGWIFLGSLSLWISSFFFISAIELAIIQEFTYRESSFIRRINPLVELINWSYEQFDIYGPITIELLVSLFFLYGFYWSITRGRKRFENKRIQPEHCSHSK